MSTGIIFRQAWWDNRKAMIGIGIGGASLAILLTAFFPMFKDLGFYNQLVESPIMSAILGEVGDYSTPEGFLGTEFFSMMPLFLAFYTVIAGLGIISADEDAGRLDLLLSTPLPRWRVMVEKFLALVVVYLVIIAMTFAGFVLVLALMPEIQIAPNRLAEGVLNLLPVMLVTTALPLLLSVLLRGRSTAGGIAAAVIIASWFVTSLSDLAPAVLGTVKYLSIFTYYHSVSVLSQGINWGDFLLLTAIAAALFRLSLVFFQRRDLST